MSPPFLLLSPCQRINNVVFIFKESIQPGYASDTAPPATMVNCIGRCTVFNGVRRYVGRGREGEGGEIRGRDRKNAPGPWVTGDKSPSILFGEILSRFLLAKRRSFGREGGEERDRRNGNPRGEGF